MATSFLPLYIYRNFSKRSRAANSAVLGQIWPNFKLIRDFMVVLIMHQSFVSGAGDIRDIAGLKCRNLTSDVSRQCRGCAGVLISRENST